MNVIPILLFFFPVPLQPNKGTQAPNAPPLEETEFLDLPCSALSFRQLLLLVDFLIFPCTAAGFFPPPGPVLLAGKLWVFECSVTRVLGLSSGFEEAKSRTGKNKGSDELEG
ncbi:hypothetical protein SLEP1_g51039 [Rubroshorea leprosula]|uniref:Uncharacterized protein n=1 Tax=Rubroshorea leprosula TaxID=152421 RepID=A0AAV5M257_9ROSI|nr:hypothetical protein SLEP1_g51039 [Rubroshorea leprosula]